MKPRYLYRVSVSIMTICVIVNIILAVYVVYKLRKPQVYNVIIPPAVPSVTNDVSTVALLSMIDDTDMKNSCALMSTNNYKLSYNYALVQGVRTAIFGAHPYIAGDRHAYGIISAIYPERIYLSNGDIISNANLQHWSDNHDNQ